MSLTPFVPPSRNWDHELKQENARLKERVAELERDLLMKQQILDKDSDAVLRIQQVLHPLYNALQHLFEQMDMSGVGVKTGTAPQNDRVKAVWESWKQKLGGKAADAIDALLLHGEMTHAQLKIHIKCGQQTVYDTVHRMHKAGIINKNGGKISLKQL